MLTATKNTSLILILSAIEYWKQSLSSFFFLFIVALLILIDLEEPIYHPPWLMDILFHI